MKYYKISEYLYLVIGLVTFIDILFFEESIFDNPLLVLFCSLSIGMYFFRRYYRTKFNKRNKD